MTEASDFDRLVLEFERASGIAMNDFDRAGLLAVLEAMQEPGEALVEYSEHVEWADAVDVWQAMLTELIRQGRADKQGGAS